jgi:hypothetical protein
MAGVAGNQAKKRKDGKIFVLVLNQGDDAVVSSLTALSEKKNSL